MQRIVLSMLLLLSMLTIGETYTVILKTGKTFQGTLITETDDAIVFKDKDGIQYSLKKKSLDLDKMREANAAAAVVPPEVAPAEVPETPPATSVKAAKVPDTPTSSKKASKVYTSKDIATLRDKYGDVATVPDDSAPPTLGTVTPDNYYKYLQDAGARMGSVIAQLNSLLDGMATAWEVASSTGRDPSVSVQEYMTGKAATEIVAGVSSEMSNLESFQDALANPPKEYAPVLEGFQSALEKLRNGFSLIREYDNKQNMTLFRNRILAIFAEAQPNVGMLQSVQPPLASPQTQPDATEPEPNPVPPAEEAPQSQPDEETPSSDTPLS